MSPSPIELVRPRWSHLEYSWQLDNFWELRALACVEALDDENGSLIWSQSFGDNERGRWQMKLYPYGDLSPAGRGHVSLFLSMNLKSLSKAYAVFGCYLLDEEGNKISNSGRSFTRQKFSEGSSSWGWSQFIKNEGQSLTRFLTCNDSLIIKCEIEVFTGILTSPPLSLPSADSWDSELRSFLCDPRHYNVTILAKDGRELRARKEILQARSKWFLRELERSSTGVRHAAVGDRPFFCEQRTDVGKVEKKAVCADVSTSAGSAVTSAAITPTAKETAGYTSFGLDDALVPNQDSEAAVLLNAKTSINRTTTGGSRAAVEQRCQDLIILENIPADLLQNIIEFTHTDECQYHDPSTKLADVLDLLVAAKELEVHSLYRATCRRLCSYLITKGNAIAIQHVAKQLEDRVLEEHCTSYLTLCVRDLSKDEIIKTLTTRKTN